MSFNFLDPWNRLLHDVYELRRQMGVSSGPRLGYVKEVKEGGGERKCRVVMGHRPDGSEWLSPWLHCDDHSGGSREQQYYKPGQTVYVNAMGNDFRQATIGPGPQSQSFPQPDFCPQTNGDCRQHGNIGERWHQPGDQQQGSGQGGAGGGGGGSGGQSGGHIHDTFMFEAQQPPQHQDQPNFPLLGGGGGYAAGGVTESGGLGQQGQQGQQQQVKPKVLHRVHEKDKSITNWVDTGQSGNRSHTTDKGAEIQAQDGKSYGTAFASGEFQVVGMPPQVNKPWKIKKKDHLKNTDTSISKS
jgi:hypothetical protein